MPFLTVIKYPIFHGSKKTACDKIRKWQIEMFLDTIMALVANWHRIKCGAMLQSFFTGVCKKL